MDQQQQHVSNPTRYHYSASPHNIVHQTPYWTTYRSLADLSYPNVREIARVSSVEPTGYPRIAPKSHAISARRHPQWATCKLRVDTTWIGADRRPLRRHRRPKGEIRGCSAGYHGSADTMDTSLTSRARRVALQRPRRRPVPGRVLLPADRPTSKKSTM